MLVFLGGEEHQGNTFGTFDFGISLANMFISALNLGIVYALHHHAESFFYVIRAYGMICLVCALIMVKLYGQERALKHSLLDIKQYISCIYSPKIWLLAGIVLCAYFIASSLSYINAYLSQVLNINQNIIYFLVVIRLNILVLILAPLIGKIVDYFQTSLKVVAISFGILFLGFTGITFWYDSKRLSFLLIGFIIICSAMSVTLKIIAYMPIQEMHIEEDIQGFVIGFVSFVGYLPDSFYYGVMGKVLDRYPVSGFRIIFLGSVVMAILGVVCGRMLKRDTDNQ